ncbi:MAG: ABC transporter ATP-binding protein, partial [Desulfobacterales bacterium]
PQGMARAVEQVSLAVAPGEIYALVGESGCGKSSAAHAVMRLINTINAPGHQISGRILYGEQDLLALPEEGMCRVRGKTISMIFQNPLDSLNPLYRAGYQVYEAVVLDRVGKIEAWQRVRELFDQVRISDPRTRMQSYPQELSGGMRQRVMIGMMLSRNPRILIADEPTTALDVTIQAQVLELILALRRSLGMSVWVITHDFGIVAEIADRVGVMYAGVMVEESDVYRIFDNPRHPYTRMLMESLPKGLKRDGRLRTIAGVLPDPAQEIAGCRFEARCPDRLELCKLQAPPMLAVEPGHRVACHRITPSSGER